MKNLLRKNKNVTFFLIYKHIKCYLINLFCCNTGVNRHVTCFGNNLELTRGDKFFNDFTCKSTTDFVCFDEGVKSEHFTFWCTTNNLVVKCLSESNTVVFFFTEFIFCPFFFGFTCFRCRLCS